MFWWSHDIGGAERNAILGVRFSMRTTMICQARLGTDVEES
jgi:hypothetical protein